MQKGKKEGIGGSVMSDENSLLVIIVYFRLGFCRTPSLLSNFVREGAKAKGETVGGALFGRRS
jgi:hypothetical protein